MLPEEITAIDIVDAAIQRLHARGWTQDKAGTSKGPNCLIGALRHGICDLVGIERYRPAAASSQAIVVWDLLRDFAIEQLGPDYHSTELLVRIPPNYVAEWNDAPERTVEDVFLALKEVRVQLEEEAHAT